MTNNEVLRVIDSVLFDLDTNALDKAKSTLKTLQSLLKRQNELNEFKRIVYDKMLFYHSRDKAKNKKLYEYYQSLKEVSEKEFDFSSHYIKYLEIIKSSKYTSVHLCALILESLFVFFAAIQIINKSIDKKSIYIMWACYFVVLAFGLFARTVGFRGVNLNPFAFIQSFKDDSQSIIITAMNISFFIPIGFLFRNKKGSFSILIILLVLLFVETTQYIFKLGIFDIDDIIFNFIGFVIGYKIIGKIFTSKK